MKTHLPPLLSQRSSLLKVVLAAVVPALFGVAGGVMLGVSEPGYNVIALLGVAGGYAAGLEHLGARGGFRRGLVGGSQFGLWILVTHAALFDGEPKAHLPHPEILLVALTTGFGCLLGALGGRHRARLERRHAHPVPASEPAASAGGGPASPWTAIVNPNAASVGELTLLPVVGRRAAERIVAYRDGNGGFTSVEDLTHVEGFDDSRVARIAARATV